MDSTRPTPTSPSHLLSLGEQEFPVCRQQKPGDQEFLVCRQKKPLSGRRWGGWKSFFWKERNALGWQVRVCVGTTAPSSATFLRCPHPRAVLGHSLWTLLHAWLGGGAVANPERDSRTLEGCYRK